MFKSSPGGHHLASQSTAEMASQGSVIGSVGSAVSHPPARVWGEEHFCTESTVQLKDDTSQLIISEVVKTHGMFVDL